MLLTTANELTAGNASVLLGTASGIHGEHSERYIRHAQFNKDSELAKAFLEYNPTMCETSVWNKDRDIVIGFPIEPKEGSLFKKDLLGVKQLEYVKKAQQTWIEYGTNVELCVDERLRHNVSNTITVDDWDEVTRYIYDNRKHLCGVSLLAANGDKTYPQAPFTEVLTHTQIVEKYGEKALFTSALIEAGLNAFDNDLWNACNTAMGFGDKLGDGHEDLLKRDWIRRFEKFADNFYDDTDRLIYETYISIKEEYTKKKESLAAISDIIQKYKQIKENSLEEETYKNLKLIYQEKDEELKALQKEDVYIIAKQAYNDVQLAAKNECANCLKDVYNLHKWWKINRDIKFFNWEDVLKSKKYTEIDTTGAQACSGGQCEL